MISPERFGLWLKALPANDDVKNNDVGIVFSQAPNPNLHKGSKGRKREPDKHILWLVYHLFTTELGTEIDDSDGVWVQEWQVEISSLDSNVVVAWMRSVLEYVNTEINFGGDDEIEPGYDTTARTTGGEMGLNIEGDQATQYYMAKIYFRTETYANGG